MKKNLRQVRRKRMIELRESGFPRELSYYSHTLTFIFNLKPSSSTAGEPDREKTLAFGALPRLSGPDVGPVGPGPEVGGTA